MVDDWTIPAQRTLIGLRDPQGGWGYRSGGAPSVEATALACFGLLASANGSKADPVVRESADGLVSMQAADGSVGIAAGESTPGWATAYALLLWANTGVSEAPRRRAAPWLLRQAGKTFPPSSDPEHIVGHDTMLVGWPWVAGTHSWLEPTALSVLALCREGHGDHPRVREGLRLIRDRSLDEGGWNYGNKAAFGRALRPQPAPTGLALLALAVGGEKQSAVVDRGLTSLLASLPETRAASSVGWGVLGIRAWGRSPETAKRWLAESDTTLAGRADAAPRLGILLLASGPNALEIFDGSGRIKRAQ